MSQETVNNNTEQASARPVRGGSREQSAGGNNRQRRPGGKGGRPQQARREKPVRDFEQKIINIRRVTRVVAGGRRFAFSVAIVIGDGKGSVGVGMGKAGDTSLAIEKAIHDAKRNMIKLNLTETMSIPHEVSAKYKSSTLAIMPNHGRGVVAGSAVRSVCELAGMKDITAKISTRSKNKVNIARAVIDALDPFVMARGAKIPASPAVAYAAPEQ